MPSVSCVKGHAARLSRSIARPPASSLRLRVQRWIAQRGRASTGRRGPRRHELSVGHNFRTVCKSNAGAGTCHSSQKWRKKLTLFYQLSWDSQLFSLGWVEIFDAPHKQRVGIDLPDNCSSVKRNDSTQAMSPPPPDSMLVRCYLSRCGLKKTGSAPCAKIT